MKRIEKIRNAFKNRKILSAYYLVPVLAAFSIAAVVVLPQGSSISGNYKVVNDAISQSAAAAVSAAYNLFASMPAYFSGKTAGTGYKVQSGFLPTAYTSLNTSLEAISPDNGYNTGTINVTLTGDDLMSGATVKLSKTGETDAAASNVTVSGTTKITCDFDLTGKAVGAWDVVVINADLQEARLPSGFTVKTWTSPGIAMNTPNPFNPNIQTTSIVYNLTSDANVSVMIFNISGELTWRTEFASGVNGGKSGYNTVVWNGISGFGEMAANGIYFCRIIDRSTGKVLAKGRIGVSK